MTKYSLQYHKDALYYPRLKHWWSLEWKYMKRMSSKTIWLQKDKHLLHSVSEEEATHMINQYKNNLFAAKKKTIGYTLILLFSYAASLGMCQTEYTGEENKYLFSFYIMLATYLLVGVVWGFSKLLEWCFLDEIRAEKE